MKYGTQWLPVYRPPPPPFPSVKDVENYSKLYVVHQTVNIKLEKPSTFTSLRDLTIRNRCLTGTEIAVWEFLHRPDWNECRKWAGRMKVNIADFQFQKKFLYWYRFSTFERINVVENYTSLLPSRCIILILPPSLLVCYFTLSPSLPS